jgi:hypothetical protein
MIELLDLACPRCGAPLPSAPLRRVFVCAGCRATYVPRQGREGPALVGIERELVLPREPLPPRGSIVLLPVWRLSVPAAAQLPLPREIRVPALGMERMQLLVNLAVHLTRCQTEISAEPAPEVPREPAQLGPEDAFEVAELVAMGVVPGWPADEDVAALQIPLGTPRLLDLPCRLEGLQLVDLVFGRSVAAGLLDGHVLADRRSEIEASLSRAIS